jgi:fructan beta-fructosidase
VKLFKSAKAETTISADRERGRLSIDRTRSGDVTFHAKFSGVSSLPLSKPDGQIRLRLFIDSCSVEVFVNDGEQVLTCLVFPPQDSRAVELFGSDQSAVASGIDVWPLTSCWKAEK